MMYFTGSVDKTFAITSSGINLSQRTSSDIINFFYFLVVGFILGPHPFLSYFLPWRNQPSTFQHFNSKRNLGIQKGKNERRSKQQKSEGQGFKEKIITNFERKMRRKTRDPTRFRERT
ncbi:hypothetical protein AMTRI_Chr13g120960 [Amborella trichopoda]